MILEDRLYAAYWKNVLWLWQDRMHLDCVFSILGDDCCLMLDEMMGEESPTRRLVDEWTRTPDGGYELRKQGVEFSEYMRDEGYHIILIKAADQLVSGLNLLGHTELQPFSQVESDLCCGPHKSGLICVMVLVGQHLFAKGTCVHMQLYGCNVLNLGNSKVLSVHANTARQIVRSPHFKGEVQVVNFTPITSMYGAVHCSSQVCALSNPPQMKRNDQHCTPVHHVLCFCWGGVSEAWKCL